MLGKAKWGDVEMSMKYNEVRGEFAEFPSPYISKSVPTRTTLATLQIFHQNTTPLVVVERRCSEQWRYATRSSFCRDKHDLGLKTLFFSR